MNHGYNRTQDMSEDMDTSKENNKPSKSKFHHLTEKKVKDVLAQLEPQLDRLGDIQSGESTTKGQPQEISRMLWALYQKKEQECLAPQVTFDLAEYQNERFQRHPEGVITTVLKKPISSDVSANANTTAGSCLGLTLAALSSQEERFMTAVKDILYNDQNVPEEAAGMALVLLQACAKKYSLMPMRRNTKKLFVTWLLELL
ncbi:hypothetical protein RFI_38764 [Reticulomyxa filosa]|uniref:Uncharacterized protein n=1 Tax=Reticulomyxa filosa TaxID=46433 RepID=X6L9J4_RETFI|nr:hypothetical protein RFI_38764 [Reticulomyxa filosa]|eukprot:ETN98722.1 hypothetical protein RFI_38764 [Reticulomyxa filosa]